MYNHAHRGTVVPIHAIKAYWGADTVTRILHLMPWLLHPQEMAPVPNEQEIGWAPEPIWMVSEEQEILPLPGLELWTVQPVDGS